MNKEPIYIELSGRNDALRNDIGDMIREFLEAESTVIVERAFPNDPQSKTLKVWDRD